MRLSVFAALCLAFTSAHGQPGPTAQLHRERMLLEYKLGEDSAVAWRLTEPDGNVGSLVEIKVTRQATVKADYQFYGLYADGAVSLMAGFHDGFLVTLDTGAGHGFRMVYFWLDEKARRIKVGLDTGSLVEGPNEMPPVAFDQNGNPVITTYEQGSTKVTRIARKYAWSKKENRFEVASTRVVSKPSGESN